MKRLIVTADDVGMHRAMTDGALEGHLRGIVTACSVVVSGSDFQRAARELTRIPELDVGVHLTLVEGSPVAPAGEVGSLLEAGALRRDWRKFAIAWLKGSVRLDEVEHELRAQIAMARGAGLVIRHLNAHQHLHLLPGVWGVVHRIAGDLGIRYVRIANDRGGSVRLVRRLPVAVLNFLGREARGLSAVTTNDRTIGIAEAGSLDESRMLALLRHVEGVTELVTHPAVDDSSLGTTYGWGYLWADELRALCSEKVRRAIEERGITLTRPRDMQPA